MKTRDYGKIIHMFDEFMSTDAYHVFEDTQQAHEKAIEALVEPLKVSNDEKWLDADCVLNQVETLCLDQGFIYGFKCAMQLCKECGLYE